MRILLLSFALCLLVVPCLAQTAADAPTKFAAAGVAFFQSATPQFQGWGAIGIPISERIIEYTDYDVAVVPQTPLPGQKYALPRITYSMRTGLAPFIYQIAKGVNLFGLANAGIAANGSNVVGSFGGGGFIDFDFGKGWGGLLILEVNRNSVTGNDFVPRVGIRKKL